MTTEEQTIQGPLVLFDFDNTLFDTEFLKEQMYALATIHGYTQEEAKQIYKQARSKDSEVTLTLEHYVDVLKERLLQDKKEYNRELAVKILALIAAHDGKLPGAAELLSYVTQLGFRKILLTLGIPEWQEQKIQQGKLRDFFSDDEIIFTTDETLGKLDLIRSYAEDRVGGAGIIVFNDKPSEMREVLEMFSNAIVFGRYEDRDDRYTAEQFEQLEREFPARFMWSDNLFELKDRFEEYYG